MTRIFTVTMAMFLILGVATTSFATPVFNDTQWNDQLALIGYDSWSTETWDGYPYAGYHKNDVVADGFTAKWDSGGRGFKMSGEKLWAFHRDPNYGDEQI